MNGDSFGTLLQWTLLVALSTPLYVFIFRGRRRGFEALASRTMQLRQAGVGAVYYLYSNRSPGANSLSLSMNSIGPLLATGYLAYEQDGWLLIEFPWWNAMRPLARYSPDAVTLSWRTVLLASRTKPGIGIGDRAYLVAGVNLTDAAQAKRLWGVKDNSELEANRQLLADQLVRMGFRFAR